VHLAVAPQVQRSGHRRLNPGDWNCAVGHGSAVVLTRGIPAWWCSVQDGDGALCLGRPGETF